MAGKRSEGVYSRTRKRDGRVVWDACWNVGGKKYWKKGLPSKADAVKARRKALSDADEGRHVPRSSLTVEAWFTKWAVSRHATCKRYVAKHIVPALGPIVLQKLTAADIRAHYAFLQDEGLAANTVRLVHVYLRGGMDQAERDGVVVKNIARDVTPPKKQRPDTPEPWDGDELRRFLATAKPDRLYPFWRLACMTGMRRGELLGLRWSNLDLDASMILVEGTKTDSSRRSVDIDAETVAVLRTWKRTQLEEWMGLGGGRPTLVFTHETGRASSPKDVFLGFNALQKADRLRHVRFHDLRHAHATHLLKQGTPIHVVSQRLGHASPTITLGIYAHVVPGQQAEAAAKFAAMFE